MLDSMQNLSPEVLAACFRFLGFRDLITASHVSRFWRASALAFPDLWAHVSLDGKFWNSWELVHMAMTRVGQHPVDFQHLAPERFADGMAQAISQHFHRFRSFECAYSPKGVDTCRSAPLLHQFVCNGVQFDIPPGFLGGSTSAGSLRTLLLGDAAFPPECHALSSVTNLRVTYPQYGTGDAGFRSLFALCPRLEILHLYGLVERISPGVELPLGPAPRTLMDVVLHTWSEYNVAELYTTWALEAIQDVQLVMPIYGDVNANFAPFFADATSLSVTFVREDWGDATVRIIAELPDGLRCRTVVCTQLTDASDSGAALAGILQAPQVQKVTIPLGLLAIAAPLHRWPRLAHLCVHIYETKLFSFLPEENGLGKLRFSWTSLECLRALPAPESLELHVCVSDGSDPPTLDDALEIKACLDSLHDCIPREVHVHGFPTDVAREMGIGDHDEPRLVFTRLALPRDK